MDSSARRVDCLRVRRLRREVLLLRRRRELLLLRRRRDLLRRLDRLRRRRVLLRDLLRQRLKRPFLVLHAFILLLTQTKKNLRSV